MGFSGDSYKVCAISVYPERYHPPSNYVLRLLQGLNQERRFPSTQINQPRRRANMFDDDTELQVLAYIRAYPRSSIRHVARESGVSYGYQDGAPAHNAIIVRQHLNKIFPNRWICTNGVVPWPARSSDLTPLDFFVWGYLKTAVYADTPVNLQDLKQKIQTACDILSEDQIKATSTEFLRRLESCLEHIGENFEQFIR
ncbi:uncharacterized protein LOC132942126 [Metopolophium dirhodum]|uniref:uncharacterized protein LOC132942126 n=1 Tax=Metopolophium dirhodum TaxID=44670 RepID=UPI00298F9E82|nr:uncharacterized protein LOC132942126 [Metopolophium dirhodum]